jgi:cellulose synthase (UDP-forming)
MLFAIAIIGLAIVLLCSAAAPNRHQPWLALASAAAFVVSASYIAWRIINIPYLGTNSDAEFAFALVFLGIEMACTFDLTIALLMMSRDSDRKAEADRHERRLRVMPDGLLPNVDVWIATYNEGPEILEKTLLAAKALDWPAAKLRIWVLDDGKRDWLRTLCEDLEVEYVTRPDNKGRKAGNHNNALKITSAPYILSLDADFIPFPQMIYRLVGFFDDANIAIVQSPQTYYNTEPMRQNLMLQRDIPDELDPFYLVMQPARDAWGAAFYVGSCAMIRRAAIESIGGFETATDIEDQVTSIKLIAKGWRVRFLQETLSLGLHPESNHAYHDQRNRWCRGSLQILFMPYGPFGRGLSLVHRLFFAQTYWYIANLGTVMFVLTPAVVWIFGWRIFPATDPNEVLAMPLLQYLTIATYLMWRGRGYFVPIVWHGFQLFAAITQLPVVLSTLIRPFGKPLIKILHVTPKGELARRARVDWPTLIAISSILGALLFGIVSATIAERVFVYHAQEMAALMFWSIYAAAVMMVALSCCVSLSYRRLEERFDVRWPGTAAASAVQTPVAIALRDISAAGARIDATGAQIPERGLMSFRDGPTHVPYRVVKTFADGQFGISFVELEDTQRNDLTRFIFTVLAPNRDVGHITMGRAFRGFVRAMLRV